MPRKPRTAAKTDTTDNDHGRAHGEDHGNATAAPTVQPTASPTVAGYVRLSFSDFVLRCHHESAGLLPRVWISSSKSGDAIGGSVGAVDMMPLADLEERIIEEAGGPRLLILRTKHPTGVLAFEGFLPVDAHCLSREQRNAPTMPRASTSPATPPPDPFATKLTDIAADALQQRLAPQAPPTSSPPTPAPDPFEGITKLVGLFPQLRDVITPSTTKEAVGVPADLVEKLIEQAIKNAPGSAPKSTLDELLIKALEHGKGTLEGLVDLGKTLATAKLEDVRAKREQQKAKASP